MPEREALFDYLTGRQFVVANAELHGLADPGAAAQRAIALIEMTDAQDRAISTYSKGMRQRIKMASALVHDPAVLLLDEPFNGMDPRQRIHLMELLRTMGAEGRTVLFSSHILEEVEQVARQIEVVVAGRHAASGDFGAIRRLMTDRPNRFVLRTADDRLMASALLADPSVRGASAAAGGRDRGARRRTSAGSARCCRGWPASTASACSRSPPPTSRWRASSPTWCRRDLAARSSGSGLRSIFGRWRGVLLFVLPVVLIGCRCWCGCSSARTRRRRDTLDGLGLAVIVPLVALLATSGLLAPEIDDGSISYLLAKPISRHTIVLSKLVVAVACVLVFAVVPMLVAGLILLPTSRARARLRRRLPGRRPGLLRALRAAVGADPARRRRRPHLPAGLGGAARRAARRRAVAQHHPVVGGDHRARSPTSTLVDRPPARRTPWSPLGRHRRGIWLTGRRLRAFNLTGDE